MSQDPGKALKQMRQKLSLLPIRSGFVSPAEIEKIIKQLVSKPQCLEP